MMYKDFQAIDIIKANFDNMEEKTMTKEEKRQSINKIVSGTIKGLICIGVIYVICCLVFGLTASASTYDDYEVWRDNIENTVLEHTLSNDLYYEVWEAEEMQIDQAYFTLIHRQDKIEIVEHTQVTIVGKTERGCYYGYGNVNEFVVIQDKNIELSIGEAVDCWFVYANNNYCDSIESFAYAKPFENTIYFG